MHEDDDDDADEKEGQKLSWFSHCNIKPIQMDSIVNMVSGLIYHCFVFLLFSFFFSLFFHNTTCLSANIQEIKFRPQKPKETVELWEREWTDKKKQKKYNKWTDSRLFCIWNNFTGRLHKNILFKLNDVGWL